MAVIPVEAANFEQEVLKSELPVLVDFWAEWCSPCRILSPVVEEIAEENAGRVKVCKINTDEQQELAIRYGISAIPTLMVFKNGEVANTSVGVVPKAMIEDLIK